LKIEPEGYQRGQQAGDSQQHHNGEDTTWMEIEQKSPARPCRGSGG